MSKYGVSITELKEEKYLVQALREMGYRPEVHHEAVPMNSYYSEQEAKQANIIIRRHELRGACGDIGFARPPGPDKGECRYIHYSIGGSALGTVQR